MQDPHKAEFHHTPCRLGHTRTACPQKHARTTSRRSSLPALRARSAPGSSAARAPCPGARCGAARPGPRRPGRWPAGSRPRWPCSRPGPGWAASRAPSRPAAPRGPAAAWSFGSRSSGLPYGLLHNSRRAKPSTAHNKRSRFPFLLCQPAPTPSSCHTSRVAITLKQKPRSARSRLLTHAPVFSNLTKPPHQTGTAVSMRQRLARRPPGGTCVHLKMGGRSKMSRRSTSSSGVARTRSVTMSVQCPKISSRRAFFWPSLSLPPAGSLWKPYLHRPPCWMSLAGLLHTAKA